MIVSGMGGITGLSATEVATRLQCDADARRVVLSLLPAFETGFIAGLAKLHNK